MQQLINMNKPAVITRLLPRTFDEIDSFLELGLTHKDFSFQRQKNFSIFLNYKFFLLLL